MESPHIPLVTLCRHFETMGILMQKEDGILDYEEGVEANLDEEI